jgi:hypothetical protein
MSLYLTSLQNTIKGSELGIEEESNLHLREGMHFILTINC